MLIQPVPDALNYGAGEDGDIYRLTKPLTGEPLGTPRRLNPIRDKKSGRLYVTVYNESGDRQKRRYVHKLVALAWLGPCPTGHEIHHRDLDSDNNKPANLEYLTRAAHRALHARVRKGRVVDLLSHYLAGDDLARATAEIGGLSDR